MRTTTTAISSLLRLSLLLITCQTVKSKSSLSSSSSSNKNADVTVLYPRDVYYDSTVRLGLDALQQQMDSHNNSSSSNSTVVYDLPRAVGCPHLFTMTLVGSKQQAGSISSSTGDDVNQDRAFVLQMTWDDDDDDNSKQQKHQFGKKMSSTDDLTNQPVDSARTRRAVRACGVLDGHGSLGHDVAEFGRRAIVNQLIDRFRNNNNEPHWEDDPNTTKSDTSVFLEKLLVNIDQDIPNDVAHRGGAAVSMIAQVGLYIYTINAGDSQSFLLAALVLPPDHPANTSLPVVLHATRLDKPDMPEEKKRLEQMGGRVTLTTEQDEARVWYTFHNLSSTSGQSETYGLAMSRGIGDRPAVGVIATPIIQVYSVQELVQQARMLLCPPTGGEAELDPTGSADVSSPSPSSSCSCSDVSVQLLAVSATDGLIDYVNGTTMAESLLRHSNYTHPFLEARNLIYGAAEAWDMDMQGSYRDDMALAVFEVIQ